MSFKTLSGDRTINAARAACHKSLFPVSPVRLAEAPASPPARRAAGHAVCFGPVPGSWLLAAGHLGRGRSQRCAICAIRGRRALRGLLFRQHCTSGHSRFSFTRASAVVNCHSTPVWPALHPSSHAATRAMRPCVCSRAAPATHSTRAATHPQAVVSPPLRPYPVVPVSPLAALRFCSGR